MRPIQFSAAWLAAASLALTLTACGGSSGSSGAVQNAAATGDAVNNNSSPDTSTDPASSPSAASDAAAASDAVPASDPVVTPSAGFQVGTTTYDPNLPPEPTLPAASQICATLPASLTAQSNGLLPDTADATNTAPDTARIQAALDSCKNAASTGLSTNKAVRLVSGPNGENAFLAGALNMQSGVTLWIDKQITLFASRDPRQFDKTKGTASCGMITSSDNGCLALINASKIANGAVVGDGVIDGRGGSPLVSSVPTIRT
jgi:polygalacturonase